MKLSKLNNRLRVFGLLAALTLGISSTGNATQVSLDSDGIRECIESSTGDSMVCKLEYTGRKGRTVVDSGKEVESIEKLVNISFTEVQGQDIIDRSGTGSSGSILGSLGGSTSSTGIDAAATYVEATITVDGCSACSLVKQYKKDTINVATMIAELSSAIEGKVEDQVEDTIEDMEKERLAQVEEERQRKKEEAEERRNQLAEKNCVRFNGERIRTSEDRIACFDRQMGELEGRELDRFVNNKVFPYVLQSAMQDPDLFYQYVDILDMNADFDGGERGVIATTLRNSLIYRDLLAGREEHEYKREMYIENIARRAHAAFGNTQEAENIIRTEISNFDERYDYDNYVTQSMSRLSNRLRRSNPIASRQLQNVSRAVVTGVTPYTAGSNLDGYSNNSIYGGLDLNNSLLSISAVNGISAIPDRSYTGRANDYNGRNFRDFGRGNNSLNPVNSVQGVRPLITSRNTVNGRV